MAKIFHIMDEMDERGYGQRGGYGSHEEDDRLLEKAFKEGCEHGYKKAMRELEKMGIAAGGRQRLEEERKKLKESLEKKEKGLLSPFIL